MGRLHLRRRILFGVLLLLAGIGSGAGLVLFVGSQGEAEPPLGDESDVVLPVGVTTLADEALATLLLSAEPPGRVGLSPEIGGRVTALHPLGDSLGTGMPVIDIDGVTILAAHSPTPFYRSIAVGDSGPDVEALRAQALAGGHYGDSESDIGKFTWRDRRAARLLMESLGWPDAQRLSSIPTSPLLWIHEETFLSERLLVELGQYVEPGSPVVEGKIVLDSIVLLSPVVADASLYVFTARDGLSVDLGSVNAELDRLAAALPYERLLTASEGGLEIDGTIRLRDPGIVWTIPSAAITVDPQKGSCALFAEGSGEAVVRPVDIVGGGLDLAEIKPMPGLDIDELHVVVGTEPVEC